MLRTINIQRIAPNANEEFCLPARLKGRTITNVSQESFNAEPCLPPAGDPKSLVPYLETFLGIVETGTTGQVFTFWIRTLRTELETISDENIRAEALRLLQEVNKAGHWFSHEARRPGEALPLILSPIRALMEYLKEATPQKS